MNGRHSISGTYLLLSPHGPWLSNQSKIKLYVVVVQSVLTLYSLVDCSKPGFPVLHHLAELAQTHVHWISDAVQPSCPLSSPSPPVFSLSQHQSLFSWVCSSYQVAKVLELQLQHQSFQWIFQVDFLWYQLVWSLYSPRDPQESSPTPWFKSISSTVFSLLYIHTWLWHPYM